MSTIKMKDIYPKIGDVKGQVGIEIEVEAANPLPPIDTTWWKSTLDNSLRGGMEYINKTPLPVDDRKLARITKLTTLIDTPLTNVNKDSHRTSIHVHNNVGDFTPVQVWTAITAYWLLENLLFKWFGKEREGLLFCLRLMDADHILKTIKDDLSLEGNSPFGCFHQDGFKYGAINIASINRLGSLELRGMRGTVDPVIIDSWSTCSYKLLENAKANFFSPEDLLDFYYHKRTKVLDMLLPPGEILQFVKKIINIDDLMEENACRMADFVYSTDWKTYGDKVDKIYLGKTHKVMSKTRTLQERFADMAAMPEPDWGMVNPAPVQAQPPRPRVRGNPVPPPPDIFWAGDNF